MIASMRPAARSLRWHRTANGATAKAAPVCTASDKATLRKASHSVCGDHQVIEHPYVD